MSSINFGGFQAMVGETDSTSTEATGPRSVLQANTGSEYSLFPNIGHKLNGQNYNLWSRNMLICIGGRGKEEYLTLTNPVPSESSPQYKQWKLENNTVMSWLLNSMVPEVGEQFMYYKTAAEMWEAARETFSNRENTSVIFEIKSVLHNFHQRELTVTDYYTSLTRYWQQLDVLDTHSWQCAADGKLYKEIRETDRLYMFLLGLNRDLDEVRGRILSTKPLPSIREAFSEVRREESRRKLMLGPVGENSGNERAALVARLPKSIPNSKQSNNENNSRKGGRPWCEHCKRVGHTKETCWKLHGKPLDWKPSNRNGPSGGSHGTFASIEPFSLEQIEALKKLLQDRESKAPASQNNSASAAFSANSQGFKPWIVDSGASDHMTGDINLFSEFKSQRGGTTVRVADGSNSTIDGVGTVKISKEITLRSVLFVPNLDYNLLSVSKLTQDLNCITKFYSNMCEFQDASSGMMIGSARVRNGLYLLHAEESDYFFGSKAFNVSNESNVMLWHHRLGHPNFVYLRKMYPQLFNGNKSPFQCEICQLSKHVRHTFSPLPYKASHPFYLIHSDVWGPSRMKNVSGSRWFVTFIDDHTRVTWLFLMKEKSEVGQIFQTFCRMIQNQFSTKIQVLKTDNAKEYFHSELGNFLSQQGIIHLTSCVDTPQQNGVAERKNRHLLEVTRSLLLSKSVPTYFWGEAVMTATYLINRMPSRVLGFQTPLNSLQTSFPHIRIVSQVPLKVFGCVSFVHNHKPNRSKFDPRSIKCIFLGYSSNQRGYKCYSPVTRKMYTTMDVTFFENQSMYPQNDIQGENLEEYRFLTPFGTSSSDGTLDRENPAPLSPDSSIPSHIPNTNHPPPNLNPPKEYIVYTRRSKAHHANDHVPSPEHEDRQKSSSDSNQVSHTGSVSPSSPTIVQLKGWLILMFQLLSEKGNGYAPCTQ